MDTTFPQRYFDVFTLERWVQRTIVKYPYVIMQKGFGGVCIPYRIEQKLRCTIEFRYIYNCTEYIYLVSTPRLQKLVTKALKKAQFPLIPLTQSEFVAWMEERGTWHAHIKRTKGVTP